jgi:hypothetical protein
MVSSKTQKVHGFSYLRIFVVLILVIIVFSLFQRLIILYNGSMFRDRTFTLVVIYDVAYVIHADTDSQKVSIISVPKNDIEKYKLSWVRAGFSAGVPIDAIIYFNDTQKIRNLKNDILSIASLPLYLNSSNAHFVHTNQLDFIKLVVLVSAFDYKVEKYKVDSLMHLSKQDELREIFKDTKVLDEQTSVEIVNGSDVTGVGAKIADMLRLTGVSVVSVRSEESNIAKIIHRIPRNYTIDRLERIFPMTFEYKKEQEIADVTLYVDKEFVQRYILE